MALNYRKYIEELEKNIRKYTDEAAELTDKSLVEERDFTAEEQEKFNAAKENIEKAKRAIERCKSAMEFTGGTDRQSATRGGDSAGRGETRDSEDDDDAGEKRAAARQKRAYSKAFEQYLRYGSAAVDSEQRAVLKAGYREFDKDDRLTRALSTQTGTQGGYLAPSEMLQQIEVAMREYAAMLQVPTRRLPTSNGNDLSWPTVNDTMNEGEQLGEGQIRTEGPDNVFGKITMKAFTFGSRVMLIPVEMVEDSAYPIFDLLSGLASERLGRILNRRLTTGNNATQPQGIVPAAAAGPQAASGTTITYDNLVDLELALDPAYWPNAGFMMSLSAFGVLRKLRDNDGRPLWMPAATSGLGQSVPATINSKPYYVNTNMAPVASGNRALIYGDFSKYVIREVGGITIVRLVERYADQGMVGYFATIRRDGRLNNAGVAPVVALIQP